MQKEGKVMFFMHPTLFILWKQVKIFFHVSSETCNFNPHCSLNVRVDDVHVNLDETSPLYAAIRTIKC